MDMPTPTMATQYLNLPVRLFITVQHRKGIPATPKVEEMIIHIPSSRPDLVLLQSSRLLQLLAYPICSIRIREKCVFTLCNYIISHSSCVHYQK